MIKNEITILVVDDSKQNIDILVHALSNEYTLFVCKDGLQALDIIQKTPLDLILLDVLMPEMDGYEVCRRIKASEYKDIPIIFLSGQDSLEDKTKGFALGAVDYITKPFDIDEVRARIKTQVSLNLNQKTVVLENHFLQQEVMERNLELKQTYTQLEHAYLETIERLSRAAEFRDDETGMHVKRVGRISAVLAKAIGLEARFVAAIEHAAPLHDIGKMGIPEGILLKPDKLNPREWDLMKNHTIIGKNILKDSSSSIINMAEIIAYTHHEKWNGKGYPLGLKGEQIPTVSRIVALADVFDALTSDRPYKTAFSLDEAVAIILEEEGHHFEPRLVRAFIAHLSEIEAIRRSL